MRRICAFLSFVLIITHAAGVAVFAEESYGVYPPAFSVFEGWAEEAPAASFGGELDCKGAVLMESGTGKVLYASGEKERLPIASVTKIMSTLLVVEAIDSGKITVGEKATVSAYAASMGGSQVFLEPGEQMTVHELLKCLVVASANDAAVTLAEHIYGSAEGFVAAMNERAGELGMENTCFVNTTGLDDGGYSSAEDVALMTRELLKHPMIFEYTTIWMDTIRDGAFGLTNTNRLIRFYKGANGMKTGFTTEAMYCVSATAERDGMQLIAVILGAPTSDARFAAAKKLLDFGFANYRTETPKVPALPDLAVSGGTEAAVSVEAKAPTLLLEKGKAELTCTPELPESVAAPVKAGQTVGTLRIKQGDTELCTVPITAKTEVKLMSFGEMLKQIWKKILSFV